MLLWYTARGAGLAALVLFTVATAGGAVQSSPRVAADRRIVLQYVHRTAAVAGLVVLTLHIATIIADSYADVGVIGAVVPFASEYRPWAVALGTVAVYGLIAVAASGAARRSLARSAAGARRWRMVHLASIGCWAMALAHGVTAGTDAGSAWVIALYVLCGLAVVAAVGWRALTRRPAPMPSRPSRSHRLQEVTR